MDKESIKEQYPEMTADEYRNGLAEIFSKITHKQALRYFYILVSERVKCDEWMCGGAVYGEN